MYVLSIKVPIQEKSGNLFNDRSSDTAGQRNSTKGQTSPLIPKHTEQGLQSEDIEKRGQGETLPDRSLDRESLRTLPVYLHHCLRVVIHHTDPFGDLQIRPWTDVNGSARL